MKADLIVLSEKHERLEGETSLLRKALTVSQRDQESAVERERNAVSTLISEKEILLDQIRSERSTLSLTQKQTQI